MSVPLIKAATIFKQTPQLYLLTNEDPIDTLLLKLEQALASQVIKVLQIRRKLHQHDPNALHNDVDKIVALACKHNVTVIINDNVDLAKEFGVGVHLGQEDTTISAARKQLGLKSIIGKTCYQSVAKVDLGITHSANYLAMGALFKSTTKPEAKTVTLNQISIAARLCHSRGGSLCVIGGITLENVNVLKGLNIKYIALCADILEAPLDTITKRCQLWQTTLDGWHDQ